MLPAILKISLIYSVGNKLQLSKLKSAILQMNTCYYRDCYTENANKTNCMEFIWKDEWHPNSSLNYHHVWDAKYTNTYGTEERWLSRPKLMQQYCRSAKGSKHVKAAGGHFEHAIWIDFTSINMSRFFTIIKTVSISWNWTDQLLFTYIIALCTSHSHNFVCGQNILIKCMPISHR